MGKIIANEVPTARCINRSLLYPESLKAKKSAGTIIIPPPAPNSPAKNPERHPNKIRIKIIFKSNIS